VLCLEVWYLVLRTVGGLDLTVSSRWRAFTRQAATLAPQQHIETD
jgi:hypothetical protein